MAAVVEAATDAWSFLSVAVENQGGPVSLVQRMGKWFLIGLGGFTAKKFLTKTGDAIYDPFFERWLHWVRLKARAVAQWLHLTKPNMLVVQPLPQK